MRIAFIALLALAACDKTPGERCASLYGAYMTPGLFAGKGIYIPGHWHAGDPVKLVGCLQQIDGGQ